MKRKDAHDLAIRLINSDHEMVASDAVIRQENYEAIIFTLCSPMTTSLYHGLDSRGEYYQGGRRIR